MLRSATSTPGACSRPAAITAARASSPSSSVGCCTPRARTASTKDRSLLLIEARASTWRAWSSLAPDSMSISATGPGPDLGELVDDAQRGRDVVEPDAEVEALGDLAVVDLDAELPHRQPAERLGDDERHLGLEVRGELADVDDVDVGLGELAEPPLLRPLAAPDLLDLVAAEREGELAGVLEHVAGEGHGEVEVQAQRGIPAAVVAREPADAVDLLVGVAALAEQPLDGLDGPGLERREAVQLEDLTDDVEEVQLEEAFGGQELGEPGDGGHLGGGRVHAVNPRRYGLAGSLPAHRGRGPVAGEHERGVGQRQHDVAQGALHRRVVATGQVGAADGPGEEHVTADHGAVQPLLGRQPRGHGVEPEHDRALGVPGRVQHLHLEPGEVQHLAVGDLDDPLGLAPRGALPELLLQHLEQAGHDVVQRVVQAVAVVGVDVRRRVAAADRGHRVDVVDVPVGQQHRGRPEPVLGEHVAQGLLDADAGVDDEALLPGPGART